MLASVVRSLVNRIVLIGDMISDKSWNTTGFGSLLTVTALSSADVGIRRLSQGTTSKAVVQPESKGLAESVI
ncbi:hypothetical protein Tco_1331765 [Tanacetum coccineum]